MIGARARRRAVRAFVAFSTALLFMPAVMTYTHLFGRQVTLRIDRCERQPRGAYECHGSWTDSGGRHSTTVSHVGVEDTGRTFKARLGPMGAHAGSLWEDALVFLFVLPLAVGVPGYLLLRRQVGREVRGAARRLLDAPDHYLTLQVDRDTARRPDGEEHLRVRFGDPDVPVPVGADRKRFASARRADGRIVFHIERRADQVLMLDADGRAETVVPHLALQSGRPRIERPDGSLLGEIVQARGHTGDVHSVIDPGGAEVGRFARFRRGTWALCLAPDCSPMLSDSVLAYLFTEGRAA